MVDVTVLVRTVPTTDGGWVAYVTVYDPVALAKRPVPPVIVMTYESEPFRRGWVR